MKRRLNDIVCDFVWEKGSLNSNGIRLLRERLIPYQYYRFDLYARAFCGTWCKVEYKKLPPAPGRNPDTWIMILNHNKTAPV